MIKFSTKESATRANVEMKRTRSGGNTLRVQPLPQGFPVDDGVNCADVEDVSTVSVYNIRSDINRFELHKHFCRFGSIMHCRIARKQYQQHCTYLEYTKREEAELAVRLMKKDDECTNGREQPWPLVIS